MKKYANKLEIKKYVNKLKMDYYEAKINSKAICYPILTAI